jgi:hypothetical protein
VLRFVNKRYTSYLSGKIHPTLLILSRIDSSLFCVWHTGKIRLGECED